MTDQADDVLSSFRKEYQKRRGRYRDLTEEVRWAIDREAKRRSIILTRFDNRTKTIASALEKIGRKTYTDPWSQLTDLAGVRVVCPYSSCLEEVEKVLEDLFQVVEKVDKSLGLGVDRMGYSGRAYVVRLRGDCSGPRYEGLRGLQCEVQVRTILQDAWAIFSQHLDYKHEGDLPAEVKRELMRVSPQLETAQKMVDNVREASLSYRAEVQQKKAMSPTDFLAQPVNSDTLSAYTQWKYPDKRVSLQLQSRLLQDLNPTRYPTLATIDTAVASTNSAVEAYANENPAFFQSGTDYLTKSLGFYDAQFRAKHGFAQVTRSAFDKYMDLVIGPSDD